MDIFLEYIVKHKRDGKDYCVISFIILAAVILTFVLFLFNRFLFGLGLLLIAGVWYGAYLLIQTRNIEYEYILTNNELDIDKIIARKGRKRVITINFKEIEVCANIEDANFKHMLDRTENISQHTLCGDMRNGAVYFVDFYADSSKQRVIFQPSDKMIEAMHSVNPRNVHIL